MCCVGMDPPKPPFPWLVADDNDSEEKRSTGMAEAPPMDGVAETADAAKGSEERTA